MLVEGEALARGLPQALSGASGLREGLGRGGVAGGSLGSARQQGGLCAARSVLCQFQHRVSHRTEPSEATAPGSPSRAGSLAARVHRTHAYDL